MLAHEVRDGVAASKEYTLHRWNWGEGVRVLTS
jgi:hypothetical protein